MAGSRKLFEDVGSEVREPGPKGGMIDAGGAGGRGAIRAWLGLLFALVAAMIVVGGLTRLTDSGLSITEWRPVTGTLPPLAEADWLAEFAKYQQSPEFQLQNSQMDLDAFKAIYWWEWGHRLLGRVVGLVWAAGLACFWMRRQIPAGCSGRLLALGVLGGMQGAIGWWMVASGLQGRMVDVASYRLALHLGLAFAILGLIAWMMLGLSRSAVDLLQARRAREAALSRMSRGFLHLLFMQILLGALVAGIDAGRAFPTWPLMGDSFFPADAFYVPGDGAIWRAFFENPGLVQFVHRLAAYLVLVLGAALVWRARGSAHVRTRRAFHLLGAVLVVQLALGIATVLHAAPLGLALAHQTGAVALWVAAIAALHRTVYPIQQSVRGTS